ncbi:MAG: hypothetical protein HY074_14020 [Deltaproteobacteria bacterium]|nr:hypothetical protein [Deltaproteobacteria bacterium]
MQKSTVGLVGSVLILGTVLFGGCAAKVGEDAAKEAKPLVIGVRYLAFRNPANSQAVAAEADVSTMVKEMNTVWSQCNLTFQLEEYKQVDPREYNARYSPANYSELDNLREATENSRYLTLIATGPWNRSGTLGASGSNCYSSFPGDAADGVVCESRVAVSPMLHAHEAGHWFGLYHTDDPNADGIADTTAENSGQDLMNHFVRPEDRLLTPGQCERARQTVAHSRTAATL